MKKGSHLGEFEQIVMLAAARLGEDGHGAAIHEHILETTGRDVSIPAVYVTLSRLEKKGLVTARAELAGENRGGRPRKFFELTKAGVRELQAGRLVQARLWEGLSIDPLPVED